MPKRRVKKTRLELIEERMRPEQIRLMERVWDNIRWANYTTYGSTLGHLRGIAADSAKKLAAEPDHITENIEVCKQAGAAVLWLEEMHYMIKGRR